MKKLIFICVKSLYKVRKNIPEKMEEIKMEKTVVDCFSINPKFVPEDLQKQCEKLFPVEEGSSMQTCNNCSDAIRVKGKTIYCVECHARLYRHELDSKHKKASNVKHGPNALVILGANQNPNPTDQEINKERIFVVKFKPNATPPFSMKMHVDAAACSVFKIEPISHELNQTQPQKYFVKISTSNQLRMNGLNFKEGAYEAYVGDIQYLCRNKISGYCQSDNLTIDKTPKTYEDVVNMPYIRKANLIVDQGVPKFVFDDYCIHCNGKKSTESSDLKPFVMAAIKSAKYLAVPEKAQKPEPEPKQNQSKTVRDWTSIRTRDVDQVRNQVHHEDKREKNEIRKLQTELANLKAEVKQKDLVIQALSTQIAGNMASRVTSSRF